MTQSQSTKGPANAENESSAASGILLVAHGSRVESSNAEIKELAQRLKTHLATASGSQLNPVGIEPVVEYAFLELAEPSIGDAIDQCATHGVTTLHVLPYFLAAGRHVRDDIPEEIERAALKYPEMQISLSPHVGKSDLMLDLLVKLV